MTGDRKTVAIIGAGIVGVSTAVWLQRNGHDVILIDRKDPGEEASHGNGGILASCSVVPVTTPGLIYKAPRMLFDPDQPLFLKWGQLPRLAPWLLRYLRRANADDAAETSRALMPIIGDSLADHQALAEGTGAEAWVHPGDYLFIYRDRAHFEGDAFGWKLRREAGFEWEELEGEAFKDYDPVFSDDHGFAIRLPNHGRITDPGRYVKALAAHVEKNGGRILKGDVEGIRRENGSATGVRVGGETIACDAAVVTAGVWSRELVGALGINVPLETERGYHVEFHGASVTPRSPVMIASGKFVITPMEGRLRAAGIVELGSIDAPPSRAPFALLKKQVQAALPGLSWEGETEWMGHRPAPADSIPVIGEAPDVKGAFMGFGHHHVGLTGGPKTGRLLAQLVSGRTPNIDMSAYAPARHRR